MSEWRGECSRCGSPAKTGSEGIVFDPPFTRQDVRMLRAAADDPEMWSGEDWNAALRSLANRIEALLPPESPSPDFSVPQEK